MGAVNTTYTFTATDTITSTKMNNIIDETVMTSQACLTGGGLEVASGQLTISANAINSSRLAANSVSSSNIVDGTIVNADISPTAAIAGTKIVSQFGTQGITATGNLGLSGSSSNYTAAALVNTSGVETQLYASGNTNGGISTITNHPFVFATNNTERMRITAAGNVGVGTTSPYAKFTVTDDGQDGVSLFSSINDSIIQLGGFLNPTDGSARIRYYRSSGDLEIQTGQRDTYTERFTIVANGNVGIGKTPTTKLDVNGTVTATAFAGPLTGNSSTATTLQTARTIALSGDITGTATSFNGSANISIPVTVDNAVITAPKLSGAQTGTAPVYGIRAYARVQGNGTVDINKGFSSISRVGTGIYDLTLTTAPSAGSVPAITTTCHTPSGNSYNLSAAVQINSSASFTVKTGHEDIQSLNDADFSIMVIY